MQNMQCCVFNNTGSVITQLHYFVFTMLKPACVRAHLSCCLAASTQLAFSYCTTYLREEEQRQSAKRFKKTVNNARDAICSMLNQLYAYRQTEGICPQSLEFYQHCTCQMQDVLNEVELCWSAHCTGQCRIPDEYLHNMRPVLQRKFTAFKSFVLDTDVSQELTLIINTPVTEFIAMKDARSITIHDMVYMEKLLTALENWKSDGPYTDEGLNSLLLEMNFNGKSFTEYYYQRLQERMAAAADIEQKLMLLEKLADNWYGHLLAGKPAMIFGQKSVMEELMEWVLYQWWHCNQELLRKTHGAAADTPEGKRRGKGRYALKFGDEPAVVSAMFHMMHKTGMYEGSLKSLFDLLAQNAEFPNSKNLNPEYLMKAGKQYKEKADKQLLLNYLPDWYRLTGGKMPGQRS